MKEAVLSDILLLHLNYVRRGIRSIIRVSFQFLIRRRYLKTSKIYHSPVFSRMY